MYRFEDETDEKEDETTKEEPTKPMMERLMDARTITLFGEINMKVAQAVSQKLLALATISDEDITFFINSPGGHVESGDTIFDMIRYIKPRVKIVGTGWVASAGALIYAAAPKEDRFSLPNTRYLLHQPMGGTMGQASDIAIEAEEILKMRKRLNQTFADQTGQLFEQVETDTDRNFWMSAEEAMAYGLVGNIINTADEL